MKHHVWIASHFHNKFRCDFFLDTIKSICTQTHLPDIVVISYSFQHDIDIDVKTLLDKHFKPQGIHYIILQQPQRLYQFEHIKCIYDHVVQNSVDISTDDIMVTFCDDDDMLHEKRMEMVNTYVDQYPIVRCLFYIIEDDTTFDMRSKIVGKSHWSEFGCYSCRLQLIGKFLEEIDDYHNNTDLYFMASMRNDNCFLIEECLYYHRRCLFLTNINIWRIKKELTETKDFITIVDMVNEYIKSKSLDNNGKFYLKDEINKFIYYIEDKEILKNYWISEWLDLKEKDITEFMNQVRTKTFVKKYVS